MPFFKDKSGLIDPVELVLNMIIDDGVPCRGHRINLFKPEYVSLSIGIWDFTKSHLVGVFDFHTNYVACYPERVDTSSMPEWKPPAIEEEDTPEPIVEIPGLLRPDVMRIWPAGPNKDLEVDVYMYYNFLRLNPKIIVQELKKKLKHFKERKIDFPKADQPAGTN